MKDCKAKTPKKETLYDDFLVLPEGIRVKKTMILMYQPKMGGVGSFILFKESMNQYQTKMSVEDLDAALGKVSR